jgi:hypothetical protein
MDSTPYRIINGPETARLIKKAPSTLARRGWRTRVGLPWHRCAGSVVYLEHEVLDWLEMQLARTNDVNSAA